MKKRTVITLLFFLFLSVNNYAQNRSVIRGKVSSQGKGVSQVVVTDGFQCVQTDAKGNYQLTPFPEATFIYLSVPSGYKVPDNQGVPIHYIPLESEKKRYDFALTPNQKDETKHRFVVHADPQLYKEANFVRYQEILADCKEYIQQYPQEECFGIDCGDLVGDKPQLYPSYISSLAEVGIPFYRAMGNHDMTLFGCSNETSRKTFESYFGPSYYSFNKGKAHYVILNDVFYLGRDYFYMGYLNGRMLKWLEEDLSYVPQESVVFIAMHIPTRLEEEKVGFEYSNQNIAGRVSNADFLYELLKPFRSHILTGHTHYNRNLEYTPRLYEHITAAVCGTWWQGAVCLDGTPQGYGVYEVRGDSVSWFFKSAGFPSQHQMRIYPVGEITSCPDHFTVNVWNWDKQWRVEWLEDGELKGEMTRFSACDPEVVRMCADKEKLEFSWISAEENDHMFRAKPVDPNAKITVRVTDRFGNIYLDEL